VTILTEIIYDTEPKKIIFLETHRMPLKTWFFYILKMQLWFLEKFPE